MQPITLSNFPRAILHIDGDSFFASCEVAKNPKLKGLPVVTGIERGIASSLTYEAKAAGVKRAMSLLEVKKVCPNAVIKLRRHKPETKKIFFYLKTQSFRYYGMEIELSDFTFSPNEILNAIGDSFDKIFDIRLLYRATGIILSDLDIEKEKRLNLFGRAAISKKFAKIFTSVDEMAKKYGKHTLFLGSSLEAIKSAQHQNDREIKSERKLKLFKGETARKRLYLPMFGEVK